MSSKLKYKKNSFKFLILILLFYLPFFYRLNSEEFIKENSELNFIDNDYLEKSPNQDYILGIGDKILIDYGQNYEEILNLIGGFKNNFRSIREIDINGKINIDRFGYYYVEGLSIEELENLLTKKLSTYLKDPYIQISIAEYRNVRVFVNGEVESPGYYVLKGKIKNQIFNENYNPRYSTEIDQNINFKNNNNKFLIEYHPTVFDLIQKAGGITNNADLSKIKITRNNPLSKGGGKIYTEINFLKAMQEGDSSKNIRIYDGDSITIKKSDKIIVGQISEAIRSNLNPKFINVFVSGRVEFPGQKAVRKLSSLNDAIEIAGGAKVIRGPIILTRYEDDGEIYRKKLNYNKNSKRGSKSNPYLKSGDLIRVSRSKLNIANEILDDFTKPIRGLVTSYGIYKIFDD